MKSGTGSGTWPWSARPARSVAAKPAGAHGRLELAPNERDDLHALEHNVLISLIALASVCGAGQAIGAEVCPAKPQALRSVTVFDGPTSEQASLVPDLGGKTSSSWELG